MPLLHASRRTRYAVLAVFVVGVLPYYLNGFYNPIVAIDPAAFWSLDILIWSVLPAGLYLFGRWQRLFTPAQLGLHTQIRGRSSPLGVVVLCLIFAAVFVKLDEGLARAMYETFVKEGETPAFNYRDMIPPRGYSTGAWRLATVLYMAVSAGLVEEIFYRGMLRLALGRGWVWDVVFVAVSAVVFAGAHFEGGKVAVAYALSWGVIFSVLYVGLDNLWPMIVGHGMIDLFALK